MSPRAQRTRSRKRPGTSGRGRFYHVEVRPKERFATFRTQDVGAHGHLERVAGKRKSGRWNTVTWLIAKKDAHVEGKTLVIDDKGAKTVLKQIRGKITHVKGDIFTAGPRKNVPERKKPTKAQREASRRNLTKARLARRR